MPIPSVLDIRVDGLEHDFFLRELERIKRWMSHLPVGRYELLLFPHEIYIGEVEARIAALKIIPWSSTPSRLEELTTAVRKEYWEFHSAVKTHEALLRKTHKETGRYYNPCGPKVPYNDLNCVPKEGLISRHVIPQEGKPCLPEE